MDVLANNAGFGLRGAVEEAGDEEIAQVFGTNLFGPIDLIVPGCPACASLPYRSKELICLGGDGGEVSFRVVGLVGGEGFAAELDARVLAGDYLRAAMRRTRRHAP